MLHRSLCVRHTCTGYLKKVVFFELLEDASFNFNKLVRHEERQKCVIVRVDRHVKGYGLAHHHEGVHD